MKFIGRQKWDANLSAEDSLIALDLMECLGFEKRTDFIRHALTNRVLADQERAFTSVWKATAALAEIRVSVGAGRDLDAKTVARVEAQLRQIHADLHKAIT
ncbi:hypothetical protein [uncultured Celeribacter sp.]|uniref:hypothetical protein n=1 Tax=uncultured Celeribacter sp. TaxID=1303376 RepID=UPI002AA709DD|nr:hypothetical protein [uncultured Celeribacter sp.]